MRRGSRQSEKQSFKREPHELAPRRAVGVQVAKDEAANSPAHTPKRVGLARSRDTINLSGRRSHRRGSR